MFQTIYSSVDVLPTNIYENWGDGCKWYGYILVSCKVINQIV